MRKNVKRKINATRILMAILSLMILIIVFLTGYIYLNNNLAEDKIIINPENAKYTIGYGKYSNEIIDGGYEKNVEDGITVFKTKNGYLKIDGTLFTDEEKALIIQKFINNTINDYKTFDDLGNSETFQNEVKDFNKYFSDIGFAEENIILNHPNSENLPLFINIPYYQSSKFMEFFFSGKNLAVELIEIPQIVPKPTFEINPDALMVALTFDDGPSSKNTLEIVEKLKEYNAHATFFVLGSNVKGREDIINSILDSGNEIGGHSWDHPNLVKVIDSELEKQLYWVKDAVKEASNNGYEIKLFRPPYGAVNQHVKNMSPYPLINWDIDTLDWKNKNTEKIIANVKDNLKDGSIILMHDIHEVSKTAALELIPMLIDEGYQLVTVSELFEAKGIPLEKGNVYFSAR